MDKSKFTLVFLGFMVLFSFSSVVSAANVNWTVNPGDNIQAVVNNASSGDTVIVNDNNGSAYTYNENVVIDKKLSLQSKNGSNVTIHASNPSNPIFTLSGDASYTIIQGFTITGATSSSGIYLESVSNCFIGNNTIKNNLNGLYLCDSVDNTISSNIIKNNTHGIIIEDYNYMPDNLNNILSNSITGNNQGIHLDTTTANIHFNQISNNTIGLYINSEFANMGTGVWVNAENNWWGTNNPISKNLGNLNGTSDIYYNDYAGGPFYNEEIFTLHSPYLVLNVTANPTIVTNFNSSITADMTHNNQGTNTSSQGHIPDNIPMNFTTNLGTITTPNSTKNGKTNSTFNRGLVTSGSATITATLDKQSVQTVISVSYVDTVAPAVSTNLPAGTYNTTKTTTITATDNLDPNPIIYYSTNNGTTWNNQTKTITINLTQGTTNLKFYAQDTAGNKCTNQTINYVIDLTAPTVTASSLGGTFNSPQNVTLFASDNIDSNPVIYYTTNGNNPTTSSTMYSGPIYINNNVTLKFMAVDDAGNMCPAQTMSYAVDTTPDCVYSFQIPRYLNATMDVRCPWIPSEYIIKSGLNGIVKVGISRLIIINTINGCYPFVDGNIAGTSGTRLYNGYSNSLPGNVSISCNHDYVTIVYYGNLSNPVNQFSVIYRKGDPESEAVDILLNGVKQATISFSMVLPHYDERAIKDELYYDNYYLITGEYPPEDYIYWDISQLCGECSPSVKFTNTGEFMYDSQCNVNILPLEYINTQMTVGSTTISKQETVTYGTSYAPDSSVDAGFETIQTFAIATGKITDDMVQYWLGQGNATVNGTPLYPVGYKKAAYGTFMTALTTLWLSDKLADEVASCLEVTWGRGVPTLVMSGVTGSGNAYVHSHDASMGMSVNGDLGNAVSFRFMCSLMMSDIEQAALGNAGLNATSTASQIFLGIMHGEHFQVIFDEATGTATLTLINNTNLKIVIDMTTGVVKDIVSDGNFQYKGSTTSDNSYCYHSDRTDRLTQGLSDFFNSPNGHTVASVGGSMLIALGLVALGPVGWVAGAAIIGMGVLGCYYGSGMWDNPNDPRNQIDFVATVGLSFVGGPEAVGVKTALSTSYRSTMTYCVGQSGSRVLVEEAWLGRYGIDSMTHFIVSQGGGCVDSYVIHEL